MNKVNWTAVVIFSIVVLFVFLVGVSLLGGWGYSPFGWIAMLFMWLIPVGFVVLVVLGIVWLARAIGGAGKAASIARTCPNCGRAVQVDWHHCPSCGQALMLHTGVDTSQ